MLLRVRWEKSGEGCWRVDEQVSSKGYYITWPECFGSNEGAKKYVEKELGVKLKWSDEPEGA